MLPLKADVPVAPHPGSFGAVRRFDIHTGVDLYAAEGTPVYAIAWGTVVKVAPFTGPSVGMPWWLDTHAVLVEGLGQPGVLCYGELIPWVDVGQTVNAGDLIGHVTRVLRNDKGLPTTMLHMEQYEPGYREFPTWLLGEPRPPGLLDPTELLLRETAR